MPDTNASLHITHLPLDVISLIVQYLDVCSLWNLLDTCRHFRYELMPFPGMWRQITLDLNYCSVRDFYAALRRFQDSNGLQHKVRQVNMDGNNDPNISPIIMLVKFPQLEHLSARYRRYDTNLEADTKVLQEMMKNGTIAPGSLRLKQMGIYHHYMGVEPHLQAFQRTLNRLSAHGHVQLDIKRCGHEQPDQALHRLQDHLQAMQLDERDRSRPEQPFHPPGDANHQVSSGTQGCPRIVAIDASCWACGFRFNTCWICDPVCGGCHQKRLPPLANDQQQRRSKRKINHPTEATSSDTSISQPLDEFSLFE